MRNLFALNPGPWRWEAGVQAGLAISLPVALFTLFGVQSLGLMASLGGFTALYCADLRRSERMRILPWVALGLVVASVIGVLCSEEPWSMATGLIGVSAAACILTIGTGLGPPGPIMFVLVAGVSGQIAISPNTAQIGLSKFAIPALVALGAVMAYGVVVAPLLFPFVRHCEGEKRALSDLFPGIRFDRITGAIAGRVVSGVMLASLAGWFFDARYFHWMVLPVVAILQASHERRLTTVRAIQRMLGTLVGVAVFGLVAIIGPSGFWLVGTIGLLQFAIEVVVARNHGLALIFITPAALTIATAGRENNVMFMVRERVVGTLEGVLIAMIVFWVWVWFESWRKNR